MKKMKQVWWVLRNYPSFSLVAREAKNSFRFERVKNLGPYVLVLDISLSKRPELNWRISNSLEEEGGNKEFKNIKEVFKFLEKKNFFEPESTRPCGQYRGAWQYRACKLAAKTA